MPLDAQGVTWVVLAGALVLFVTEVIRPAFTALLVAVSLMLLGVLEPDQGLSGPGASATITVLCMFILAAGIERTGVLEDLAHHVLALSRGNARTSLLLVAALAGVLSAVLNNTPVVVLMVPLVLSISRRAGVSPSRYLIPVSFAAILGGTMTLVGTSTNLLGSEVSQRLGYGAFSMFTFLRVGSVVFLVGLAYVVFVAPRLTPERRPVGPLLERYGLEPRIHELVVTPGSTLIGTAARDSPLRPAFDVEVLRITRGGHPIVTGALSVELEADDVLLTLIAGRNLERLLETGDVRRLREDEAPHGLEERDRRVFEAVVAAGPHVRGATLRESRFRQRFGAIVLAVRRGREVFRDRLPDLRIEHGDTLLLLGNDHARETMARSREFVFADPIRIEPYRKRKAPLAIAIFALVIVAATLGWAPLPVAAVTGVLAMGLTRCIHSYEIYESVDWEVILVLVGLLPLGLAFVSSGASGVLADSLVDLAGAAPPWLVLATLYFTTALITQVVTNAAAVTLMAPVGAEVATALGLDPFKFILAVTFAGSAGFLTPIGYQTNLIVYRPGDYRFTDFALVGAPLLLITGVVTVAMLSF